MTTSVHWSRLHTAPPSPTERLLHPLAEEHGITLWIKRDDRLVLPTPDGDLSFCGNKWRKLKYNLSEAREKGCHTLLTFGGAYSNHLAAVAAAGVLFGFRTICIVRGERVEPLNPTLAWAEAHGMVLHFVTRSAYRAKEHHPEVQAVLARYPGAFVLPEGGTNEPALQGIHELAAELRGQLPDPPDIVAVSLGTGGTAAGLIQALPKTTRVQVYPALKGDFVPGMLAGDSGLPFRRLRQNARKPTRLHRGGGTRLQPAAGPRLYRETVLRPAGPHPARGHPAGEQRGDGAYGWFAGAALQVAARSSRRDTDQSRRHARRIPERGDHHPVLRLYSL